MPLLDIQYPDFEPSLETKHLWTYVRKKKIHDKLPGLFQIYRFKIDFLLFLLAILLEVWGLINIVSVGQLSALFQWTLVVLAILIDLLFAFAYHIPEGKICELENEKQVAKLLAMEELASEGVIANANEIAQNQEIIQRIKNRSKMLIDTRNRKIKSRKNWARVAALGIIIVALSKIYVFYVVQEAFNIMTLAVLVSYVVVAIIHIKVTGYFLFAVATWWCFSRDEKLFLKHEDKVTVKLPREHTIITDAELIPTPTPVVHRPAIKEIKKRGEYQLRTWGILTDWQLHSLIDDQRDGLPREEVGLHGLKHQLYILRAPGPQRGA